MTSDANIMKMSSSSNYQNVQFADQLNAYSYDVDSQMDPTRKLQDSSDATLDNFFSRPIKIHEEEWGTGLSLFFDIDPWTLYLENVRVINRISNYNLLRAKLKVKFVINGNGFQYGRAIASYLPHDAWDNLSTNASLVSQDIVQASQQPHIFLDPTTSTGGEMCLPFFFYKNYLNIGADDWPNMGDLVVRSINDLKHANGASDKVTISVFAWLEDVALSVLTSHEPTALSPQSGVESEVDEANKTGIISGPATTVAKVAGTLASIPAIAPFALATEGAATTVASIAKLMGYSRPPVTKDPEPFKPKVISDLAVTTVPDGSAKLTVDDKQELSIDPRIAGLGDVDPMNICEIAKRESYLTTFDWAQGTTPETLLWNARISPVTWAENALTPKGYHFPACCMAALPFKYWTGSMRFRFQIVCSAFHKGRIKVVYDPNYLQSNEYNTNYLEIVDIADKQDFTIEIGNGQEVSLLNHHYPGIDSVTQMYSTTAYTSIEEGNGVIGVYIVNELTTPNSTFNNDIKINVFVSMGDDFEVFVPEDSYQNFVFKPQSGAEIVTEAQNTLEPSAPQQASADSIGPGTTDHSLINKVYTGECIKSFRPLLKRYNLHSAIGNEGTADTMQYGRRSMFPYLRGNVTDAVDTTIALAPYNYCNTVLLHWVTLAHSGWRGSIRWKILPAGGLSSYTPTVINVQRGNVRGDQFDRGFVNPIPGDAGSTRAWSAVKTDAGATSSPGTDRFLTGHNGMTWIHSSVNPACEFEVPYYSQYRYSPGKTESHTSTQSLFEDVWDYRIISDGDNTTQYSFLCAAGEDFQVYFWSGLPRLYYESSPPLPTVT